MLPFVLGSPYVGPVARWNPSFQSESARLLFGFGAALVSAVRSAKAEMIDCIIVLRVLGAFSYSLLEYS